ncbi:unnamed protein product [Sphacelaria rigidula]
MERSAGNIENVQATGGHEDFWEELDRIASTMPKVEPKVETEEECEEPPEVTKFWQEVMTAKPLSPQSRRKHVMTDEEKKFWKDIEAIEVTQIGKEVETQEEREERPKSDKELRQDNLTTDTSPPQPLCELDANQDRWDRGGSTPPLAPLDGNDDHGAPETMVEADKVRGTKCDSTSSSISDAMTGSKRCTSTSTLECVATASAASAETCKSPQGAVEKGRRDLRRKFDEEREANDELQEELASLRTKNEALTARKRELQEVLSSKQEQHKAEMAPREVALARVRQENSRLRSMMRMVTRPSSHHSDGDVVQVGEAAGTLGVVERVLAPPENLAADLAASRGSCHTLASVCGRG